MPAGRTSWWSKDAAYYTRERVVELGEEFGPAGPIVLDWLCCEAKAQNDGGRLLTGFRALSRGAFLNDLDLARRIVQHAAEIGALDDLELHPDGRRFTCRVSGWRHDQQAAQAGARQARKRRHDAAENTETPENKPNEHCVTKRDMSRTVTQVSETVTPTGQDRTEQKKNSLVAASGDGAGNDELTRRRTEVVTAVWDAYTTTRTRVLGPRSTAKLTGARRDLILRRAREYPVADLIDAVQGWQHSPHNRGDNDRDQPYCDLELLLRDAAHIERFRDLQRRAGPTIETDKFVRPRRPSRFDADGNVLPVGGGAA